MAGPKPRPGILDIQAYVPGDSEIAGADRTIKLSSNETPLGPSPQAVSAYDQARTSLERYPDGDAAQLRQAISRATGLEADKLVCGAGSDELLNLLAQAYLGPGDEAIYTAHGFMVYRIAILASGATPVVAPEKDLRADPSQILAHVTDRTRMVFLANPNNPTGTYLDTKTVCALRAALPESVLLVLDGAYAEYVEANDYDAGAQLVRESDNTVMTRTFSKIHGLAALRIGWAYCPEVIADVLNRIRGPFNLTSAAIAAGAAAIEDRAHWQAAVKHNSTWLAIMTDAIRAMGLSVTDSVANFLLVDFASLGPGKADEADAFLKQRGIIVRRVGGYGLPNHLRITIGREEENRAVLAVLQAFLENNKA